MTPTHTRNRTSQLAPTLLDRLVLASQGVSSPAMADPLAGLLRDVEDLLNTWTAAGPRESDFEELASSISCYGSPTPGSLDVGTFDQQQAVARQLEKVLLRFETRLESVRVTVTPDTDRPTTCRLRIDGTLADNAGTTLTAEYSVNYRQGRAQVELVQS
ncbi:type VI secretion system baseplate subunit TssE [Aeoliella sp.]|uniref:type VI secretion system baseplate subunit TssE n=1 Tax=Aeoliella sp. TaxID=2795800 RepID=UPI003CCB9770